MDVEDDRAGHETRGHGALEADDAAGRQLDALVLRQRLALVEAEDVDLLADVDRHRAEAEGRVAVVALATQHDRLRRLAPALAVERDGHGGLDVVDKQQLAGLVADLEADGTAVVGVAVAVDAQDEDRLALLAAGGLPRHGAALVADEGGHVVAAVVGPDGTIFELQGRKNNGFIVILTRIGRLPPRLGADADEADEQQAEGQ